MIKSLWDVKDGRGQRAKSKEQKNQKLPLLFALFSLLIFSWFSALKKVNLPSFVKHYFYPGIH
jgi:hypothetical protein